MPLRPGASLKPRALVHDHRPLLWVVSAPYLEPHLTLFRPFSHSKCAHNEYRSLRNRVLAAGPEPDPIALRRVWATLRRLARMVGRTISLPLGAVPDRYSGTKRALYARAEEEYREYGEVPHHLCGVRGAFVKVDKDNPYAKDNPDPRLIQPRSPVYNVAVAYFLKPTEDRIYGLSGGRSFPFTRAIGKGLSASARAAQLRAKMLRFTNPVVLSLDASRFDKCVSAPLLELEHRFYLACNGDREYARLLSKQRRNSGYTVCGYKYRSVGGRASGDMNTAAGNCLLMVAMVATALSGFFYDILDDGDDCLVILEDHDLANARAKLTADFPLFGFDLRVDNIGRDMEEVEWCQARPIEVTPGVYRFVRDPVKVMSCGLAGTKYFQAPSVRAKLVNTIGVAEGILNLGVPILQEYALALQRNAGTDELMHVAENDPLFYRTIYELRELGLRCLARHPPVEPTITARLSFQRAFGISVDAQLECEARLRAWSFRSWDHVVTGPPVVARDWDIDFACVYNNQ